MVYPTRVCFLTRLPFSSTSGYSYWGQMLKDRVCTSLSSSPLSLTAATMASIAVAACVRASATVSAVASTPTFSRTRSGSTLTLAWPVTHMPPSGLGMSTFVDAGGAAGWGWTGTEAAAGWVVALWVVVCGAGLGCRLRRRLLGSGCLGWLGGRCRRLRLHRLGRRGLAVTAGDSYHDKRGHSEQRHQLQGSCHCLFLSRGHGVFPAACLPLSFMYNEFRRRKVGNPNAVSPVGTFEVDPISGW